MSRSPQAVAALQLVSELQSRFVRGLESVAQDFGNPITFKKSEWSRDEGRHGGGNRYSAPECRIFNRASVNVSQIHYDDLPEKKLGSATAISTIIHPDNPHAPSVHIHVSWTEMKAGNGYWRVMADLNPSVRHEGVADTFAAALQAAAPDQYEEASAQGDGYFYIPALERHRGVTHFYLESYSTGEAEADQCMAQAVGEAAIDCYLEILAASLRQHPEVSDTARAEQLAYHTLYFFQVLTLDRGTTSGLLVHNQNDVGIMGSLPSQVDRELLASWRNKVAAPQDELVDALVSALPEGGIVAISDEVKAALAETVRCHYQTYPDALSRQATGNVVPPTVDNHR